MSYIKRQRDLVTNAQTEPGPKLSFETAAGPDHIGEINDFVERALAELAAPAKERGQICLAVDEAVTNIALYAYPEAGGNVKVTLARRGRRLLVAISDAGRPFNPLNQPAPDTTASIETRAIGGLGIHLMRHMMDKLAYRRRGRTNLLFLEKNIGD